MFSAIRKNTTISFSTPIPTQALSIKHLVVRCLEGVFAMGQVRVLVPRCVDPASFLLCGVPPKGSLGDVTAALIAKGIGVGKYF